MPKKAAGEDGIKAKQRSKSDKAKRTFELNGTYSAKHMRLKADRDSAKKATEPAGPFGVTRPCWPMRPSMVSLFYGLPNAPFAGCRIRECGRSFCSTGSF